MKLIYIPALCMAIGLTAVSCSSPQKQSEPEQIVLTDTLVDQSDPAFSMFGTYTGTLPCADCEGKDIALSIMEDGTYSLHYEYLDTDKGIIEECGTYNILKDSIIETITPSSGRKTYYVYVHGNLIASDSLGNINEGEKAARYVLKKQ